MRFAAVLFLAFLLLPVVAIAGALEDATAASDRHDYQAALKSLQPLADQGNAKAQLGMGLMYASGQGVKQDWAEAHKWYHKAMDGFLADQENPEAQVNIGAMYWLGLGTEWDMHIASIWFKKAADQGSVVAKGMLSVIDAHDYVLQEISEALKWYRMPAELGNFEAQNLLAEYYMNGRGVKQDYAEAFKWYRKLAERGYPPYESKIGAMYLKGLGVKQDSAEAAKWMHKAADEGEGEAELFLAESYRAGTNGFSKDYVQAYLWRSLYTRSYEYKENMRQSPLWRRSRSESADIDMKYITEYEQGMTAAQIAEAKRLVAGWKLTPSPPYPTDPLVRQPIPG